MTNNTTQHVITTSELDEALNDFRNMALENIAKGDSLEGLMLIAEHDQRIARTRRVRGPQQSVNITLNMVASNLDDLLDIIPKEHQQEFVTEFQDALLDSIKNTVARRS